MRIEEALPAFIRIVSLDEYHPNYERTIDVAKWAYAVTTGAENENLITSLRMRENDHQKEQRVRITKALTPVSVEMIKKYFRKLRKTDGVRKVVKWDDESQARIEVINQVLGNFYARQSVEQYLFDVLEEYTFTDPNSFLLIERETVTDENGLAVGVRVYPVEIPAAAVRHYGVRHGVLSWLMIEQHRTEPVRAGRVMQDVSEFRMYGAGWVLHAMEYVETPPVMAGTNGQPYQSLQIQMEDSRTVRKFVYFVYLNGTEEVPAIRLGAYMDGQTVTETAVTPLEPVKPLMEQLINIGSLHDLTVFLHSIPRRRELVESCDYEDQQGHHCDYGFIGEEMCPKCKGTGDKSITSEQDMIRIVLPVNFTPDQIPDLSKMAFTEGADTALLTWQQEKIDWLLKFIVYATMTRDAVTMAEVSRTATEMNLNSQDAYDKIQPYAELYSQAFELITRVTAQYLEIQKGIMVSHHFPSDYQFETEADLIKKYNEAKDAGLSYDILAKIRAQIIRKQTRSTEESQRAEAWERWRPFPDLTDEMKAVVLSERAPTDPDRMLAENFHRIRREIEHETDGIFFAMPYERQEAMIQAKIEQLTASIQFRFTEPANLGEFQPFQG